MDENGLKAAMEVHTSQNMHELEASFDITIPTINYLKQIGKIKKLER